MSDKKFRFRLTRYARVQQWNGQSTKTHADARTATTISVLASTQAEAIETAKQLSGPYTGPSSALFNGRETVNHGWVFTVDSVEEEE